MRLRRFSLNTLTVVAIATMPQMEFRPQLFTFVLVAAMLAILARHNYRRAAPLWLVIPMMALWANLHGGFIMGMAMTRDLFTAQRLSTISRAARVSAAGLRLGALTFAASIATMITPVRNRDLASRTSCAAQSDDANSGDRLAAAGLRADAPMAGASRRHHLHLVRYWNAHGVRRDFCAGAARRRSAAGSDRGGHERRGDGRGAQPPDRA